MVKSGDAASQGGVNGLIPSFPTGRLWRFKHNTLIWGESSYYTLADYYTETRTIYAQSDTLYSSVPIAASSYTQQPLVGLANNCDNMNIRFVRVDETSNTIFGNPATQPGQRKRSKTTYAYGDYGFQTAAKAHGDLDVQGDERSTYSDPVNNTVRWIIGKVGRTRTYQGLDQIDTNQMAETRYFYDNQPAYGTIANDGRGLMTKSHQLNIVAGAEQGAASIQQFGYDGYGNREWVRDPNYTAQNDTTVTTTYDGYYHAFPVTVTYPNGRSDSTLWDYTLDMPYRVTDVNGTNTDFVYDPFGRPRKNWTWTQTQSFGSSTYPNDEYIFPDIGQQSLTAPFYISYKKRISTTDGQTTWQTRWFDGRGRAIQDVSPKNGSTQTRHFDPENRLWKIVEGNVTTIMVYDANGQRIVKDVIVTTPTPTPTPTNTPIPVLRVE
jgi:hypothetical protein